MRQASKHPTTYNSKIEIICHSLSKEEVEEIVEFLYNGKIL